MATLRPAQNPPLTRPKFVVKVSRYVKIPHTKPSKWQTESREFLVPTRRDAVSKMIELRQKYKGWRVEYTSESLALKFKEMERRYDASQNR
jgi:hypothetical protein